MKIEAHTAGHKKIAGSAGHCRGFDGYTGKSIRDFMFESNQTGHINFVRSTAEALEKLAR